MRGRSDEPDDTQPNAGRTRIFDGSRLEEGRNVSSHGVQAQDLGITPNAVYPPTAGMDLVQRPQLDTNALATVAQLQKRATRSIWRYVRPYGRLTRRDDPERDKYHHDAESHRDLVLRDGTEGQPHLSA